MMVPRVEGPPPWLQPGARGLAKFLGDDFFHDRLYLWPVSATVWWVLTANGDTYAEDTAAYESLTKMTGLNSYPRYAVKIVSFETAVDDVELSGHLVRAREEARAERAKRGGVYDDTALAAVDWSGRPFELPAASKAGRIFRRLTGKTPRPVALPLADVPPAIALPVEEVVVGAPVVGFASDALVAPADHVWLHNDPGRMFDGLGFGAEVKLPVSSFVKGDRAIALSPNGVAVTCALVRVVDAASFPKARRDALEEADPNRTPRDRPAERRADDAGGRPARNGDVPVTPDADDLDGDVRTCGVDYDESGRRHKVWRSVIRESFTERYSDFPLEGEPQALHLCRLMEDGYGSPQVWFIDICRELHLGKRDRLYHEMKTLVDALEASGTYDQLNVGSLLTLEYLARRLIGLVEAHSNGVDAPNWSLARHITSGRSPLDLLSKGFRTEVTRKAKDELEIENFRTRVASGKGGGAHTTGAAALVGVGGLPEGAGAGTEQKPADGVKGKGNRRTRGLGAAGGGK
jgi:hypothetical protein